MSANRPHILGAAGLWWSFPVTNILTAGVAFLWYAKEDWKQKRLTEITADQEK
jgi:Na+-driven multidrug efflux pump